jgi:HSP20 family protein
MLQALQKSSRPMMVATNNNKTRKEPTMNALTRYSPETSVWSPFGRLTSLHDELDRLFNFSLPGTTGKGEWFGWAPALDLIQDKDEVQVRVELPGMKKEEIGISLHEGVLTISGERKREEEKKEGELFRSERYFGKFQRSISLPSAVDAKKVKATYKDGILTVSLPKAEEAKPKQIEVSVS